MGGKKNINFSGFHVDLGHVRNIHFPFDIEADTAIAVASEMVEELDLTDQDVSTIAEMIDSEIQSHIPDWTQKELSGDYSRGEFPISDSCISETKDEASPFASESGYSIISLSLERLPSGRKYWSDSPPKGADGNSPVKFGLSNSSTLVDLFMTGDSLTENKEKYPCSHIDETNLDNAALCRQPEDICTDADGVNDEEQIGGETDLQTRDINVGGEDVHLRNGPHSLGENTKSEDVNIIVEKLEELLVKQQKELDELKKQHQSAISDVLKDLSPEISQKVLDICKVKLS